MSGPDRVREFFGLLGRDQDEEAHGVFRELAFPDGVEGPPSPSAQSWIDAGEWENASVSLVFVSEAMCRKRVGRDDPVKLCTKATEICDTKAHKMSGKFLVGPTKFGWRISAGTDKAFVDPVFYEIQDGGPVGHGAHARLMSGDNKFVLSAAQWKMLASVFYGSDGPPVETVVASGESDGQSMVSSMEPKMPASFDAQLSESMKKSLAESTKLRLDEIDEDMGGVPPFTVPKEQADVRLVWEHSRPPEINTFVDDSMSSGFVVENPPVVGDDEGEEVEWKRWIEMSVMGLSGALSKERKNGRAKTGVIDGLKIKCDDQNQVIIGLHQEGKEQSRIIANLKDVCDDQVYKMKELENTKVSGRRSLEVMAKEVEEMKRHVKRTTEWKQNVVEGFVGDTRTSMALMLDTIDEMKAEMRVIGNTARIAGDKADIVDSGVSHLGARVRSGAIIHFKGQSFGSPSELVAFAKTNNIVKACGGDAIFLLHLERNQVVSEAEAVKNEKGRKDIGGGTMIETIFTTSFYTSYPASLSPGKASVVDSTSAVQVLKKLMKDFNAWESPDGSEGVSLAILHSVETIKERVREFTELQSLTGRGDKFCTNLTIDSERFVISLVQFITRFYNNHLKTTGMKEDQLWELCLELMGHILKEIVSARNTCVDSGSLDPGLYYWGMLKAWVIQERYLKNRFIDDPSLTGILVRRALLRKSETLDRLEKEMRQVQAKLISLGKKG